MADTKYSVGDKFVLQIGEVFVGQYGNTLYRMKGFNSLVFDEYGLDKLKETSSAEKLIEEYAEKRVEDLRKQIVALGDEQDVYKGILRDIKACIGGCTELPF